VGANAHGHQHLGLDRAVLVFGIFGGGVSGPLRSRIGQLALDLFEGFELLGRALHDPHGFATPFDRELFARVQGGNIHLDGRTGRFGPLGWLEAADEGGGHKASAYGTCASGGYQPGPLAAVDWGVTHGNPLASRYQGQPEIVAE